MTSSPWTLIMCWLLAKAWLCWFMIMVFWYSSLRSRAGSVLIWLVSAWASINLHSSPTFIFWSLMIWSRWTSSHDWDDLFAFWSWALRVAMVMLFCSVSRSLEMSWWRRRSSSLAWLRRSSPLIRFAVERYGPRALLGCPGVLLCPWSRCWDAGVLEDIGRW